MLSRLGKIIIQICLMGLLLFAVAAGAEGKIEAVHEGPVVLKMNDYYIIYTYPKGPYINEDHRLVMPLRSVSDLIGASVAYDGSAGTATVALDNDTVQFTVGSRVVMKNGKPLEMDTVPIIDEGHMFIPLRILFESFDFKVDINEYGIVWIQDERLYTKEFARNIGQGRSMPREVDGQRHATDIFYRLVGLDYLGRMYMNEPDMFYPLSYKIILESIEDEATNPTYRYSASYHVQNISGRDIGEGEEDFHLFYFKMNLDAVGTIKGSRSVMPLMGESPDNRPRLPRVKDEVFVVNEEALSSQQIKYIIAVGRTQALPGGKRE